MNKKALVLLLLLVCIFSLSACFEEDVSKKHAHTETEIYHGAKQPSCTEVGWDAYVTCDSCSYTTYKEIPMLGHDEVYTETTPATCTAKGWTDITCTRCDYKSFEEPPETGHIETEASEVPATCTKTGLTAGIICSGCDMIFEDRVVIPALGHAWNENDECTACTLVIVFTEGLEFRPIKNGTEYEVWGIGTALDGAETEDNDIEDIFGGSDETDESDDTEIFTVYDIFIPREYNGKPVTQIAEFAFQNNTEITSVYIPSTVKSIGVKAFEGCTSLTKITLRDNLETIEDFAFKNCAVEAVKIPNSVTTVGEHSFENCPIEIATVPTIALPSIKNSSLKYIVITCGDAIGDNEFSNCTNLISVTISDSVTSIGSSAFSGCKNLTDIVIPDSVKSIGKDAFSGCTNIILTERGVSYVDKWVISCDSSAMNVKLKDGTSGITDFAFKDCENLVTVTLPDSIKSVGKGAFYGCTNLENIIVSDENTVYISNGGCLIDTETNTLVVGYKDCVIPTNGSVTVIGGYAFSGNDSITLILIPDSVTEIHEYAFSDCEKLKGIVIPKSVTYIGEYVFSGCTKLDSISVDSENEFYNSSENCLIETESKILIAGCKNSVIPTDGSVTAIANGAFYNCDGLTSVTITNDITSIGESAFSNCKYLTDIHFDGTKAEWNAIEKGEDWNFGSNDYTIHCTNGDITK